MKTLLKILLIKLSETSDVEYRHIAIDKSGEVFAYENTPSINSSKDKFEITSGYATKVCDLKPRSRLKLYSFNPLLKEIKL